jgi:hypothetical protein
MLGKAFETGVETGGFNFNTTALVVSETPDCAAIICDTSMRKDKLDNNHQIGMISFAY